MYCNVICMLSDLLVLDGYSKEAPKPLSAQFADRLDKQEVVKRCEQPTNHIFVYWNKFMFSVCVYIL